MGARTVTSAASGACPATGSSGGSRLARPGEKGFSLVELVVAVTIGLILATIGLPALATLIGRSKIEGTAREMVSTMQLARLEAIKTGFPAVVRIDPALSQLETYVNIEDSGTRWAFDPDATKTYQSTDYRLRLLPLPVGVSFGAPGGGGEADGLTADPGGGVGLVIFRPDGSVRDVGAFRVGDSRDNFLEARVEPEGTARIELRKWDADLGEWLAQGEEGRSWSWN